MNKVFLYKLSAITGILVISLGFILPVQAQVGMNRMIQPDVGSVPSKLGCLDDKGKQKTGVEALNCGLDDAVSKSTEVRNLAVGDNPVEKLFGKVIQSAMTFLGVIMLVLFIYAGILYMVGVKGGSDANITKAKDVLKWTVAGSVILFGSYAIVNAIVTVLATQLVN